MRKIRWRSRRFRRGCCWWPCWRVICRRGGQRRRTRRDRCDMSEADVRRYNPLMKPPGSDMTTREALHPLVDELPDDRAELARTWLEGLRDAADENGPRVDSETLASIDRGLA